MENESYWHEDEYTFIEKIRTMTVGKAALEMGLSYNHGYNKLASIRRKAKKHRASVNVFENWRKTPRLRKLLTDGSLLKEAE